MECSEGGVRRAGVHGRGVCRRMEILRAGLGCDVVWQ